MTTATSKKWDYSRLIERKKQLLDQYLQTKELSAAMEGDTLDHFFGAGGYERYQPIARFCEEHNIKSVVDIGCAYGHQGETFKQTGIAYHGVDEGRHDFWDKETHSYTVGQYPCDIPVSTGDLGISVLCLTWNVYLHEDEKTLQEQCEALSNDFDHVLLYMGPERVSFVGKYFKEAKKVEDNLYYFTH